MIIWKQGNILVNLTGVWVLPTGIGALRWGSAVCGGGGGWGKLAASVGPFARLWSAEPSSAGGRTISLLGRRRWMLWRTLLVQLNSFTNCKKSTDIRPVRCCRMFGGAAMTFAKSWPDVESTLLRRRGGLRMLWNRGFFTFSSPSFSGLMLFCACVNKDKSKRTKRAQMHENSFSEQCVKMFINPFAMIKPLFWAEN